MLFSLVSALLLASFVRADDDNTDTTFQNKAIINEFTTATLTVTPGQPVVTPTIAAPSYSVYQTTETSVVNGVTQVVTVNPKIVNDITVWVTVTADAAADVSASAGSSSAPASSTSEPAATSSSAISYSSTSWVTETEVDTVTVDAVFTVFT